MHINFTADRAVNTPVYLPHCTYVTTAPRSTGMRKFNKQVFNSGVGFLFFFFVFFLGGGAPFCIKNLKRKYLKTRILIQVNICKHSLDANKTKISLQTYGNPLRTFRMCCDGA